MSFQNETEGNMMRMKSKQQKLALDQHQCPFSLAPKLDQMDICGVALVTAGHQFTGSLTEKDTNRIIVQASTLSYFVHAGFWSIDIILGL